MKVTTDTILEQLKEWVENKMPISPHLWLDAAIKLNVLKGDESAKLFDLQQSIAQMKMRAMEEAGATAAKAKIYAEATDKYKAMKVQEAKIVMIEESIKLSKYHARMGQEDYRSQ